MISDALRKATKAAVKVRGLRAFSRDAGVPNPTIARFLTGERSLQLPSADRIAAELGLELANTNGPPRRRLSTARLAAELARLDDAERADLLALLPGGNRRGRKQAGR